MRRLGPVVVAVVMASALPGADAAAPVDDISHAATGTVAAQPVFQQYDAVSVFNTANALRADVEAQATAAALAVRATWALGRGASVGMTRLARAGGTIQGAPDGFRFPMSTTVLPLNAVGPLLGRDIASILAQGLIVMGKSTADFRGARAGDTVDLVAFDGSVLTFVIGMVAPDARIGGTELLISPSDADALGVVVETRIVMWGFASRDALERQLAAVGLTARADVRVRRSWDAADPDSTLGLAQTKPLLGEFAYQVRPDGVELDISPEWANLYLPPAREELTAEIPIRARCHNAILADLKAALTEVAAAGLAGEIDVDNANAYGGCFYPRFNRVAGELGFVSRHAWGQALDTNTTTNRQGFVPSMNCDVVRIFRKHNFAWGGNFLIPDGMHFEWVGERRDQMVYPSKYCPNIVTPGPATESESGGPPAGSGAAASAWAMVFSDDGWAGD